MGGDRKSPRTDYRALLMLLSAIVTASVLSAGKGQAEKARSALALDVSSPVDIANGNCSFGPAFDEAFRNMIVQDGLRGARARAVVIGGQRRIPRLTGTRNPWVGEQGFRDYESVVHFSRALHWNGLRLTGLRANTVWEGEATALEFADRPERVRDALRAIGLEMPLPPEARDIPIDACSAQIMIEARRGGSSLICSSGC